MSEKSNGTAEGKTVEAVKMTDGRVVEFVGTKRKMLKESLFGESGDIAVRLDFRNGETRTFPLPKTLIAKFAAHGAEQKLGDETAGEEDIDDMIIAVDTLIARLENGEWSTKREGGGFAGTSVLLRALVEYRTQVAESKGETADVATITAKVKEFLSDKKQAEKMALRTSPKLKSIVERLEAEKTARGAK